MKRKNCMILILCACMAVTACAKEDKPAKDQTEMGIGNTDGKAQADPTDIPEAVTEPPAPTRFVIPDEVLTPAPTPTPKAAKEKLTAEAKEIVSQYEKISFGNYEVRDETATMVRNSNISNMGTLCGAEDGTVYFTDNSDKRLCHANADGSGQELILEYDNWCGYLQIEDGYLYFGKDGVLCRYDLEAKNIERVLEQTIACFTVSGQKIYYCDGKGLWRYDMETGQSELLVDTGGYYEANWMTVTEDVIIYTFTDPADPSFINNGLLFAYFLQDGEVKYIRGKAWMPVLAGKRAFFQDSADDGVLKSLDLNTGETVSYEYYVSRPSISEEKMYFIDGNKLYCHDFQTGESSLCFENEGAYISFTSIFQTADCLYLYQGMGSPSYYYKKADGTYGKFGAE